MNNQINVDINQCETEVCDCGSINFEARTILKRISALKVGATEDIIQPIQYFACEACGKPHKSTKINLSHPPKKGPTLSVER